jgi:hypothetical protein
LKENNLKSNSTPLVDQDRVLVDEELGAALYQKFDLEHAEWLSK